MRSLPLQKLNELIKRVTGIDVMIFKSPDPDAQREGYKKHLELPTDPYGWTFLWRDENGNKHATQ